MDRGEYVGERPELKGKHAYVSPGEEGQVKAQFDDLNLLELACGWHEFPTTDFAILVPVSWG